MICHVWSRHLCVKDVVVIFKLIKCVKYVVVPPVTNVSCDVKRS